MRSLTRRAASVFGLERRKVEVNDILYFLKLIQKRKWRKVRRLLRSSQHAQVCKMADPSGLTPLGAALGCNAPLDITRKILNLYPEAILQQDEYGSTPLHFGCLNGSHPDLVELILEHEHGKEASVSLDSQNYGPLHHAISYTCTSINDDNFSDSSSGDKHGEDKSKSIPSAWLYMNDDLYIHSIQRHSLKIISLLCHHSPEVLFLSTNDGYTPLDIIQRKKLSTKNDINLELIEEIYEELKQAGVTYYKKLKKGWEDAGYNTERRMSGNPEDDSDDESLRPDSPPPKTQQGAAATNNMDSLMIIRRKGLTSSRPESNISIEKNGEDDGLSVLEQGTSLPEPKVDTPSNRDEDVLTEEDASRPKLDSPTQITEKESYSGPVEVQSSSKELNS
jgi:hypothetical protein